MENFIELLKIDKPEKLYVRSRFFGGWTIYYDDNGVVNSLRKINSHIIEFVADFLESELDIEIKIIWVDQIV